MLVAYSIISRTRLRKLNSLVKQVAVVSKLPGFKSFTTTQHPQSLGFSNSIENTHYRKKILLANLFQRYGIPSSMLYDFIAENKFLMNSDVSELEQSLGILLLSFKLPHKSITSLVCDCPSALDLKFLKKWEAGSLKSGLFASFPGVVKSVLEFSRRFQIDPERFSVCVKVLRGLGFSDRTINRVLEEFPGVVMMNERGLKEKIEFWSLQEIEREDIDKIYYLFPIVLEYGIDNRLKPLLNELMNLGFGRRLVREAIIREPRILCFEVGEVRWYLEVLRKLRCRDSIKEKIFENGEFKAAFAVKLRIDCLCKYGLIRRDALNILKREPRAIIYDIEDIKTKVQFLLEKMKFSVDSLIDVPEYLGVNFDKQIVPRYNVIEYLRSRDGLGFEMGLRDIIKPTRLKFYNLYVKPYPECEKLYGRFSEYIDTKSRHPIGLWKCFKPPKHPESKDDVKNMRSFTESLT
ncbi:transcription termination factor MTERF15, mitochondrial [Silene latifolia]|uniref:transcription termination factor MTERF15, mitochondrial n=1 Tax=Silene latifolia TaxID=37657 RepID=UPI003D78AD17